MEDRREAFARAAQLLDWYREQQQLRDGRVWGEQDPSKVPQDYQWHYQRSSGTDVSKRNQTSSLELLQQGGYCIGDPDDCIKYLDQFEATGLDEMMPLFQIGPIAHEEIMASIRLFGKYVIPHFQEKAKARASSADN